MAELVPAIHVLMLANSKKDVDARHKAGHGKNAPQRTTKVACSDPPVESPRTVIQS